MAVKFSIIVPACEVAPYVQQLIMSLKMQTYTDFEVLFVCEESRDGTADILRKAAADDKRFRLAELPRSGSASVSRNYGIEHAAGEYLVFIDGDDWIVPDALAVFAGKIASFPLADIIISGGTEYRRKAAAGGEEAENWEKVSQRHYGLAADKVFSAGTEALAFILNRHFYSATWMNIYRREFLAARPDLRQAVGRRHQDDEWTPRVFFAARQVLAVPFLYYCYRKRLGSVTTLPNPKSVCDWSDNLLSFFAFWESHPIPSYLRSPLATWYGDFFFRYLAANYARTYPRELRAQEIQRIIGGEGWKRYLQITRYARFGKKALAPILALARCRPLFPLAELLYQTVYHPLFIIIWPQFKRLIGDRGKR